MRPQVRTERERRSVCVCEYREGFVFFCSGRHSTAALVEFTFTGSVPRVVELQVDEESESANDAHCSSVLFHDVAVDAKALEGRIRDQLFTTV